MERPNEGGLKPGVRVRICVDPESPYYHPDQTELNGKAGVIQPAGASYEDSHPWAVWVERPGRHAFLVAPFAPHELTPIGIKPPPP